MRVEIHFNRVCHRSAISCTCEVSSPSQASGYGHVCEGSIPVILKTMSQDHLLNI